MQIPRPANQSAPFPTASVCPATLGLFGGPNDEPVFCLVVVVVTIFQPPRAFTFAFTCARHWYSCAGVELLEMPHVGHDLEEEEVRKPVRRLAEHGAEVRTRPLLAELAPAALRPSTM